MARSIARSDATRPALRYSAEDPALLLWVHATLLDTSIRVYELLVGSLTAADRDEYLPRQRERGRGARR